MKCDQNLWFTEHHSKNWWILHGFRWFCNHLFCLIFRVPYCFARFGAIHHLWMITSSLLAWTNSFENTSHLHLCLYHSISVCIHLYCLPLFFRESTMPNLRQPSSWPTLSGEENLAKAVERWHSALHPATGPSVCGENTHGWISAWWFWTNPKP